MKNLFIILLGMLTISGLSAQSQTRKPVKRTTSATKTTAAKSTSTTSKKTPVKTAAKTPTRTTATPKPATYKPVESQEITEVKSASKPAMQTKANAESSSFKAAVGLKFIYGLSLTGKVFISGNSALEGILRYNTAGGLGSNIAFTGLYEYHQSIKDVAGLRWYVGGGGHVNYFSWKDNDLDAVTTFGVAGIIGLEYKFKNLPLAVSADWQPGYIISNNIGFSAENGGIGVKYTF